MKAVRLKTEYLHDPLGIGITVPRLFWNCEDGQMQTAWQVIARNGEGAVLWDSGKTEGASMRVAWAGPRLGSRARVVWQVRLWDESGHPGPWSDKARFELGLLRPEDWQAQWIAGDYTPKKNKRYPVDCFRRRFTVNGIKKARLYITACGLYEAQLNGVRVGDFILAPGITDYKRRIQYQTYDVTALLKNGQNSLCVQLADGWFRGSTGAWGLKNQYGTQTKLLAQLELSQEDGTEQTIISDESWEWSNDGPIRVADNKDGEAVEAWRVPGYGGRVRKARCSVTPTASDNVPVTEHERFSPRLLHTPSGKKVLDFGQNIAGYVRFSTTAKAGQTLFLRFGELLDDAGEFTQKNIQCSNRKVTTPLQQVRYLCRDGVNDYKTTFAIFGFQYVLVETDIALEPKDFEAIAVYSDMEQAAQFESSNALLDQFVKNTLWSAKNNSADLPTDCPTRERHGWTGDAQIFCGTACYLLDYMPFARKYLRDVYDWQKENGCLPQIVPEGGVDFYMSAMDGSVGWADAGVLMPYVLWKQYGDEEILREHYDGMARYARFMQRRCGKWYPTAKATGLGGEAKRYLSNYGQAYGEWAEPADVHTTTWKDCAVPHPEVATAYTSHVMNRMAEIADALGKKEDAADYRRWAKNTKKAYQALAGTKAHSLDTDRQARLVRPLAFGLLDERQTAYAKRRLVEALEHYGWRLGTGFLSTPLILDVLAEIDIEYAYRLLENEEMPGWLFMPKNGATTVWEAWEGTQAAKGIASLDHYSKGAVCEWLFKTMGGIRVDGENRFVIAPRPGGHFTRAQVSYRSIYGTAACGWKRTAGGKTAYTVTVPSNCTAAVRLPGADVQLQGPGTREYLV